MRVISQDGKYDLPYENCCVWLDNNEIIFSLIGDPESAYTMAKYSTNEKAEKAMQLLHKVYSGMPVVFQNVEIEEEYLPKFKEALKNSILTNIPNEPSKVEYINQVLFQFPKEEDL